MGLFSSKKKIIVSSSLYNLAGDIDKRTNFLKSTIASHVITHEEGTIGEAITSALLNGPGMKFRSWARWARTSGYNQQLGFEPGEISFKSSIDTDLIAASIPHTASQQVAIQTAEIGQAEYGFWVDKWMLENHPTEVALNYTIDYQEQINTIYITFTADGRIYSFQPEGFDLLARYLYVSYMLIEKDIGLPWGYGAEIIVDDPSDWPNTSDWGHTNTINTPRVFNCVDTTKTEVSYSDSTPPSSNTVVSPHVENYTDVADVFEKTKFQGTDLSGLFTSTLLYRTTKTAFGAIVSITDTTTTTETLPGGVTKTTKVTQTTQSVGPRYSYQEDTRTIINDRWSNMHVLLYKEGSGNPAYDAMFSAKQDLGQFMPFIPLRWYNNMIVADTFPPETAWNVKATKKALNTKYSKLVKQLEDNANLGDIDFAYVVFGVPLNTPDKSSRKYIFRFFQMLGEYGLGGAAEYNAWRVDWAAADATQTTWVNWKNAQAVPTDPLFGTPEPQRAIYPAPPNRILKVYGQRWNYYMHLTWTSITEGVGTGLGKPGAKVGDCWFDSTSATQFNELLVSGGQEGDRTYESNTVFMYWQETASQYRALAVTGLWHNYMVYGGKGVDTYGAAALLDPEESGFLVPIHEGIYRSISLKDATQMSQSCAYMLMNSYQIVKQKWYTKSWFKVVIIVIALIIAFFSAGSGSGISASLTAIASAATVTAAVVAVATLIATLVVNAVLASLLIRLLTPIATRIFGEEFGALVAVVASYAIMAMAGSVAGGGTAADGLATMSSAPELLKMTSATLDNYGRIKQADLLKVQNQIKDLQEDYKRELSIINDASRSNLGMDSGTIDITQLTSSVSSQYESSDSFLNRTLMLGSDICTMTNNLIGSFATITTSNELPI